MSNVESLMRDAGIACFVADQNMSILEGSIGLLQKRVMVDGDDVGGTPIVVRCLPKSLTVLVPAAAP